MKIGIKYCGGCNPRYDRTKVTRRIKETVEGVDIIPAVLGIEADYVVVVCGCKSACADMAGLSGKFGIAVVTREEDWDDLFNTLKQL